MKTSVKLLSVLFVIILILACIPAFFDIGLYEVLCEYSSGIDERENDNVKKFNGWYQITYRFYYEINNKTNFLFRVWSSGDIDYTQDDTPPPLSQYTIDFPSIRDWVANNNNEHNFLKCFVNPDNTSLFKISTRSTDYYQNFIPIILPLYIPFIALCLIGILLCIASTD